MPSQIELKDEIYNDPSGTLHKYVRLMHEKTGRNVILYSSGWLSVPMNLPTSIDDKDMNDFMNIVCGLDFDKGLDLILHTPGGSVGATESIIDFLYNLFDGDVVAYIPQLAMSGGTMIACSCKEIVMGKHSSLGPIDPQIFRSPAQAFIDEFNRAKLEIKEDPSCIPLWRSIIGKYKPFLLYSCQQAIDLSEEILTNCLKRNMFRDEVNPPISSILNTLASHSETKVHNRHLSIDRCREIGLKVSGLEEDDELQDIVLSIHHIAMELFDFMSIYKIFCNQDVHVFACYESDYP